MLSSRAGARGALVAALFMWSACVVGEQAVDVPAEKHVSAGSQSMTDAQVRDRRQRIHDDLAEFSRQLEADGRYDCCVKTPCTWCALNTGGCSCGEGLRRGEPVCEQCAYLWRRGQGDEPGIDPESVESFLEA